jgi:hypothetical protein
MMAGRPSDACPLVVPATAPAGRTGVGGQPHARLLTFAVHADAGHHCFRPEGVRTVCEAAELLWPGSAMVKHWAGFHRKVRRPVEAAERATAVPTLREGHSGVWRSDAGHEDARERRTVPGKTAQTAQWNHRGGHRGPEQTARRLVAMRDGNFRKRLTVSGDGVMAEIAAVFNEVADRNLHLTGELARVRRMVGREGKLTERLEIGRLRGLLGRGDRRVQRAGGRPRTPVSEVGRVLSGGRGGRPVAADGAAGAGAGRGGHPLRGEFLKVGPDRQQPGRPAVGVHRRGHAGGQRGGHRGQARWAGAGARYVRFVEGPHGFGQHDGVPADRSGA